VRGADCAVACPAAASADHCRRVRRFMAGG
jgi:hypothetical protein